MRLVYVILMLGMFAAPPAYPAGPTLASERGASSSAMLRSAESTKASGGWTKLCATVSAAGKKTTTGRGGPSPASKSVVTCYTYAEIRDHSGQILMGILGVLEFQPGAKSVLAMLLPLSGALPPDPGYVELDGTERIDLTYLARDGCDQSGCYGRADMTQELRNRMKSAKSVAYGTSIRTGPNTKRDGPSFAVPCCGFGIAFDGSPTPVELQNEGQRKILELLRRRLADFIG